MDRILVNGIWFEPISSRSISEAEYEQSIYRYATHLFPGYWCARFNALVESEYGNSRADMVLVDWDYRGWTVVEAELDHHSLTRHVEPQMRRLVNGRYHEVHAQAIANACSDIDLNRLVGLVCSIEPDFLVIVPREDGVWRSTLANLGVRLAIIEVFADHVGHRLVRSSGDTATRWDHGFVTGLTRDSFLPRAFKLDLPSSLPDTEQVSIRCNGYLTSWRVVKAKKATYILPDGTFDLDENGSYTIYRDRQGDFSIERKH